MLIYFHWCSTVVQDRTNRLNGYEDDVFGTLLLTTQQDYDVPYFPYITHISLIYHSYITHTSLIYHSYITHILLIYH